MSTDYPHRYAVDSIQLESRTFPWVNVVLFLATCLSTLFVGTFLMAGFRDEMIDPIRLIRAMWSNPLLLLSGLPFSATIMTILLSHEMGHYLACRYYGISATLPYFIPAPTFVGTMGAFIKIRSPIVNRPALLDVGIAGPIAGFVVALPALAIALQQSRFVKLEPEGGALMFGEPLIFKLVAYLMGKTAPPGTDMYLHPIGLAAWFGFFATALNLIPVGQLDGGHIAYALFGRLHKRISQAFVVVLIPLGIFFWQGWLIWVVLLIYLGLRHPVTLDDTIPLDRRHVLLGWCSLAMFILTFTPAPIYVS